MCGHGPLVVAPRPLPDPRGRRRGARALRHALLRLRPRLPRGVGPRGAGLPGAVRFHAALRHEGEPVPRDPRGVPGSRPPRRRVQRLRGRARPPGRLRAGGDPAHLADAVADPGRARPARNPVQRVLPPSARQLRAGRAGKRGLGPDEPGARDGLHQADEHRGSRVELRDLARVPRRGQDDRGAAPAAHHAAPLPRGLGYRPRGLEALHADDARAGGEAAGSAPPSTSAAGSRWGGCPRSRRSTWPTWASTCARSSWAFRPETAGVSASRSSRAPTSSPGPARWWRPASTWWTPGGTGFSSRSSTPG